MQLDNSFIGVLVILLVGIVVWTFLIWTNSRASHQTTHRILEQHHLITSNHDAHRLSQAIHLLHPEARLGIDYTLGRGKQGDAPVITHWSSGNMPAPDEIAVALSKVMETDSRGYVAMRRAEYPSVEDQLDAAYKARHGDTDEQSRLDKQIEEIKLKYPKSDEDL